MRWLIRGKGSFKGDLEGILFLHNQWLGDAGWRHEFNAFVDPATDEPWLPSQPPTAPKFQRIQNDARRANLCEADFSKLDLSKWERYRLSFQGAILIRANMKGVDLAGR